MVGLVRGDKMYNEEIKERFLEFYTNSPNAYRTSKSLFLRLESSEESLGKDISQMTKEEAKSAFESAISPDINMLYRIRTVSNAYVEWCSNNKIFTDIVGGVTQLDINDIDISKSIKDTLFKDEEDVVMSLKKLRALDDGYPEPVLVALAWMGVPKKEAVNLKDHQVDLENRLILSSNGEIIVSDFSDYMYTILYEYVNCRICYRTNNLGQYEVLKDMTHDNFFKRFIPQGSPRFGEKFTVGQLDNSFNRLNVNYVELGYPPKFTYSNVLKSGRLYDILKIEKSGIDVTKLKNRRVVDDVLKDSLNYRNAIWLYKFYKKAFGY